MPAVSPRLLHQINAKQSRQVSAREGRQCRLRDLWQRLCDPVRSKGSHQATCGEPDGGVRHLRQVLLERATAQEAHTRGARESPLHGVWQAIHQVEHELAHQGLPHAAPSPVSALSQGVLPGHHLSEPFKRPPGHQDPVPLLYRGVVGFWQHVQAHEPTPSRGVCRAKGQAELRGAGEGRDAVTDCTTTINIILWIKLDTLFSLQWPLERLFGINLLSMYNQQPIKIMNFRYLY